jgi:hypothetical protein
VTILKVLYNFMEEMLLKRRAGSLWAPHVRAAYAPLGLLAYTVKKKAEGLSPGESNHICVYECRRIESQSDTDNIIVALFAYQASQHFRSCRAAFPAQWKISEKNRANKSKNLWREMGG